MSKYFKIQKINKQGQIKIEKVAEAFDELYEKLRNLTTPSSVRNDNDENILYFDDCCQKLKEACEAAQKSIKVLAENQEDYGV